MKTITTARPEWETCCDEPHADEVAMLREHLRCRDQQLNEANNRLMRELQERTRTDRDARAAMKREAWESAVFAVKRQAHAFGDGRSFSWLDDSLRQLADAVRAEAPRAQLLTAAQSVLHADLIRQNEVKASTSVDLTTTGMFAELVRLRAAMRAAGELLHLKHGVPTGRCDCPGCEMTRSVHVAEMPEAGDVEACCDHCGVSQTACMKLEAVQRGPWRKCCHLCATGDGHGTVGAA